MKKLFSRLIDDKTVVSGSPAPNTSQVLDALLRNYAQTFKDCRG